MRLDEAACAHFSAQAIAQAPAAYRDRLRRKHHPQARVQTLAGLWLLQHTLHLGGYGERLSTLSIDAHNRPCFPHGPAFSISHTDGWAACAVLETSDRARAVGLDLQQHRPLPLARMLRLSRPQDHAGIQADPTRFFALWSAREAVVKATGRVGLKRIRQTRVDGDRAWLDDYCWQLARPVLADDVAVCIASDIAIDWRLAGPLSPV